MIMDRDGQVLFTESELACRQTGLVQLADGFGAALGRLRAAYGQPLRVTSCCRAAAHNRAVGGHPRSLHVFDENAHGLNGAAAIDVVADDPRRLVWMALEAGWSVGVNRRFVHLDRRDFAGLKPAVFGY